MATLEEERKENKEVANVPIKPDKDAKFKVCPQCGDRILAEGTREICDECDVPYVTEEALAEMAEAKKKKAKAQADFAKTVAEAKDKVDKAKAELDEKLGN